MNNFQTDIFNPQMGSTIPGQSGPESNDNEGALHTY